MKIGSFLVYYQLIYIFLGNKKEYLINYMTILKYLKKKTI